MTNAEFSDSFATLLNSYANKAEFGDGASALDVVLDEYEKSVILTQAQDIIVKSYFDGKYNVGNEGFDDSTRRQVDFSSLITTKSLTKIDYPEGSSPAFDDRGIIYRMPYMQHPSEGVHWTQEEIDNAAAAYITDGVAGMTEEEQAEWMLEHPAYNKTTDDWKVAPGTMVDIEGTTDVLFILNEKLITTTKGSHPIKKNYVVIPINYKEYDREMSKAYAQPLKKQAWRLFQNGTQGFDIMTELIPKFDLEDNENITAYKVRYVRRPRPIVLENLPEGLEIDGYNENTACELNPILHSEILQKAVEIALSTRGRVSNKAS